MIDSCKQEVNRSCDYDDDSMSIKLFGQLQYLQLAELSTKYK